MFSRMLITPVILMITGLLAFPAGAVDLDTLALVDIVEGITITETTALNFGDVALNDGTITIGTTGSVTDPNFLSFDATNASQGIFTVTAIAGSSDWFDCGWVTYSNAAKVRQLDVPATLIDAQGAVSEAVVAAIEMQQYQGAARCVRAAVLAEGKSREGENAAECSGAPQEVSSVQEHSGSPSFKRSGPSQVDTFISTTGTQGWQGPLR